MKVEEDGGKGKFFVEEDQGVAKKEKNAETYEWAFDLSANWLSIAPPHNNTNKLCQFK